MSGPTLVLLLSLLFGGGPLPGGDSLVRVGDLPLTTLPALPGRLLAVVLTGDGGWAAGDRSIATALVRHGVAVVGLSSPRYLMRRPTAAEASADLARILRHFLAGWHRQQAIVVGYSRGADIGPFMVSRLPADLRSRVALTALLGPGPMASFRFGLFDILRSHTSSGGLPVSAEVAKLRGTPVLCIYGARDRGAICSSLQAAGLARAVVRKGGHAVGSGDGPAVVDAILGAVGRSTARPPTQPVEANELDGLAPMVQYTFCPGGTVRLGVVMTCEPPIGSASSLTRKVLELAPRGIISHPLESPSTEPRNTRVPASIR
jgi:pimeloyl-ACP methyl ester carboxylesterase